MKQAYLITEIELSVRSLPSQTSWVQTFQEPIVLYLPIGFKAAINQNGDLLAFENCATGDFKY